MPCAGLCRTCAPSTSGTSELNGRATAAAITLYGFLALFALCVLAVAIVGIVASGNDNVAEDIVNWLGMSR